MKPSEPLPVKLFVAILYSDMELKERARTLLIEQFGKIDFWDQPVEFTMTDYYCSEMGSPIFRQFIAFQELIHPKMLAEIKIQTNEIEEQLGPGGRRKVNLDAGYLDYDKVVLASAKYNGQKIYLDYGIYADLTLHYEKGQFYPFPWSFPDFKTGIYNRSLLQIRALYKVQMKKYRQEDKK